MKTGPYWVFFKNNDETKYKKHLNKFIPRKRFRIFIAQFILATLIYTSLFLWYRVRHFIIKTKQVRQKECSNCVQGGIEPTETAIYNRTIYITQSTTIWKALLFTLQACHLDADPSSISHDHIPHTQ